MSEAEKMAVALEAHGMTGAAALLRAQAKEIEKLRQQNSEWLAANGPGGWINDLRVEVERLRAAAKYAEHIDATPESQRETMLHDTLTERDALRAEVARLRVDAATRTEK